MQRRRPATSGTPEETIWYTLDFAARVSTNHTQSEAEPSSRAGIRRQRSARVSSDYGAESLATRKTGLEPQMDAQGALGFPCDHIIIYNIGDLLLALTGKSPKRRTEPPRGHQFLLIEFSFTNSSPSQVVFYHRTHRIRTTSSSPD